MDLPGTVVEICSEAATGSATESFRGNRQQLEFNFHEWSSRMGSENSSFSNQEQRLVEALEPLYFWLKNGSQLWMMVFDVLTSQFSELAFSCELAISCVSWGVTEIRYHYSGSFG
jgi:hypothetical protein